jgi:hypothetical protein
MNLFKKALSTLLAVTMAVACLGVVNVSTVLADTTSDTTSEIVWAGVAYESFTDLGAYDSSGYGSGNEFVFGENDAANYTTDGSTNVVKSIATSGSFSVYVAESGTLKIYATGNNNGGADVGVTAENATVTPTSVHFGARNKSEQTPVSVVISDVKGKATIKFTNPSNRLTWIRRVVFTPTGSLTDDGTTTTTTTVTTTTTTESTTEATTTTVSETTTETTSSSAIVYPTNAVQMDYQYLPFDSTNHGSEIYLGNDASYDSSNSRFEIPINKGGYVSFKVDEDCTISVTIKNKAAALYKEGETTPIISSNTYTNGTTATLKPGNYYFICEAASGTSSRITALSFTSTTPVTSGTITGKVQSVKKASTDNVTIADKYTNVSTNTNNVTIKKAEFATVTDVSGTAVLLDSEGNTVQTVDIANGAYSFTNVDTGTYSVKLTVGGVTKTVDNVTLSTTGTTVDTQSIEEKTQLVKFTTNIKDFKKTNLPTVSYNGTDVLTLDDVTYSDREASVTHYAKLPSGDYTISLPDGATFDLQLSDGSKNTSFSVGSKAITVELQFISKTLSQTVADAYEIFKNNDTGCLLAGTEGTKTYFTEEVDENTKTGYELSSGVSAVDSTNPADGVQFSSTEDYIFFKLEKAAIVTLTTSNRAFVLYTNDGTINGTSTSAAVDSSYGTEDKKIILSAGTYAITTPIGGSGDKGYVRSINVSDSSPFRVTGVVAGDKESEKYVIGTFDATKASNGTAGLASYNNFAILISSNEDALNLNSLKAYCTNAETQVGEKMDTDDTADGTDSYYIWTIESEDSTTDDYVVVAKTDVIYEQIVKDNTDTIQDKKDNNYYFAALAYDNQANEATTYYAVGATQYGKNWLIQSAVTEFTIGG